MTSRNTTRNDERTVTYHAYHVIEGKEGAKDRWIPLGAYFAHKDGQGGTLVLDTLPIAAFDGRIVLRAPKAQ